jgi:voltage-gated potassium channel Kch
LSTSAPANANANRARSGYTRWPSVGPVRRVVALQTVTTVGYGDMTPARTSGRIVAAFVMLQGIAFLAILVAAITSTFVAREEREQAEAREEERPDRRSLR